MNSYRDLLTKHQRDLLDRDLAEFAALCKAEGVPPRNARRCEMVAIARLMTRELPRINAQKSRELQQRGLL